MEKALVIGSGGREHALAWKLAEEFDQVYCAPGNAGTSRTGRTCQRTRRKCHNVSIPATDIYGLADFAEKERIDLTVVGPEVPLALGIADVFQERGLKIFGPTRKAARLESSKAFAKVFCSTHGIPTPEFKICYQYDTSAIQYLLDNFESNNLVEQPRRVVIKADGLAGGKGVKLPISFSQAMEDLREIMFDPKYGDAGDIAIVERRLYGEEPSEMGLSDGWNYMGLATSQDHKRLLDYDMGPNTGGMGAYSPSIAAEKDKYKIRKIMTDTINFMRSIQLPFKGALYGGLMITEDGPQVLEFNVRFGDPETQPVLYRMRSGLAEYLFAAVEGNLSLCKVMSIKWDHRPAVCVVLASRGYPNNPEKGKLITGLDEVEKMDDVYVFHAGTALQDGHVYTDGGRVLGVTALGTYEGDFRGAINRAYEAVGRIHFDGMQFRKDIGQRALKPASAAI